MTKPGKGGRRAVFAAVSIVVMLAVTFGIITFAEFTKSSRAKRVIASYESEGAMFSSNYLANNYTLTDPTFFASKRFIYTGNPENSVSGIVTICNYSQGNPTKTYDADISYYFSAKLVKVTGDTMADATAAQVGALSVTLSFKGGSSVVLNSSNLSHNFSTPPAAASTLSRLDAVSDSCTVMFNNLFNTSTEGIFLYLLAEPTESLPGITPIDGIIATAVSEQEESNGWTGEFNDPGAVDNSQVTTPDAFDGFNYKISGNGAGTVTLSWDSTKLEINEEAWKFNEYQVGLGLADYTVTESSGIKSITFSVDSFTKGRYDTQFYRVNVPAGTSWETLKTYVTFTYSGS